MVSGGNLHSTEEARDVRGRLEQEVALEENSAHFALVYG